MKVILSRKGFDSGYGGCPSPVIEKKTMLSLPIPGDEPGEGSTISIAYEDLSYHGNTYSDMIKSLYRLDHKYCHLDPDIRRGIRQVPDDWQAAFGQVSKAQSHLHNQGVGVGDLFLFFGWFRFADWIDGKLKFDPNSSGKHMIYGYLQVGELVTGHATKRLRWHPHSNEYPYSNNTIYIASDKLVIDGFDTGLKGYGTFCYSDELVLTKGSYSRTKWELPDFFRDVSISYHSSKNFRADYFQSVSRGQEFVISESREVSNWAKKRILDNIDTEND